MRKAIRVSTVVFLLLCLLPFLFLGTLALFNGRVGADTDFPKSPLLASSPEALTQPVTLRLVTFNIQDTWFVGKNRPERMRAIGAMLTRLDPDLVGFQEAFVTAERAVLLDALKSSRLQHHAYYRSATLGSGLLILSAYPIAEAYFHRYADAGSCYKVWEGDWWAGKGAALARIQLPGRAGYIDFYDTHAQAGYGNPEYQTLRQKQMAELAHFINESRTRTAPAFLTGDMNCRIGREDYETAVNGAGLLRLMAVDSRIDHIFAVKDDRYRFETVDTVAIQQEIRQGVQLSDHTGYMSTVRITPAATNAED